MTLSLDEEQCRRFKSSEKGYSLIMAMSSGLKSDQKAYRAIIVRETLTTAKLGLSAQWNK